MTAPAPQSQPDNEYIQLAEARISQQGEILADKNAQIATLQARVEDLDAEVGMLREKLSDALAGGLPHRSDCAINQAPAYEPGPCNCGVVATADDNAYDLVKKIRGHNGWTYDESNAVNLVKSFLATPALSLERSGGAT